MAQYDGSIRIITEISTETAKKSLAMLSQTIVGTSKEINSLRSKMDALKGQTFYTDEYKDLANEASVAEKELDKMVSKNSELVKLDEKIKKLSQSSAEYAAKMKEVAAQKIPTQEYTVAQKEVDKYSTELQKVKEKIDKLKAVGSGKKSKALAEAQTEVDILTKKIEEAKNKSIEWRKAGYVGKSLELDKQIEKYTSSLEVAKINAEKLQEAENKITGAKLNNLRYDAAQLEVKLEDAEEAMEKLQVEGKAFTLGTDTEQYKNLSAKYESVNQELEKSKGLYDEIKQAQYASAAKLSEITNQMKQLIAEGKAFVLGEETQEYANLERQLQAEEEALRKAQELKEIAEKTGNPYARLSQSLDDLNKRLRNILHPIEAMKSSFASGVETMKARAAGLAASLINGLVHPFQTFKKIAGSAINGVNKLLSGMVSIAKKAGSAIIPLLKRAASAMLGFNKSAKSSNNVLQKGFKNILKYGLGIRSVYALVNKLRTAIKEGFTNMSNEIESFKAKVDSLGGSTLTLKNSFAAAFRPLVEVAIPYIQMVADNMARLLDMVGQFTAAITGQETYTRAIKQTTAAIEDENKAQNKQLSGLDKLNNLSSGSSGDSNSESTTKMFEENIPISDRIKETFQNIKALIESEDWEGIGNYIAGFLNTGLQKIYDVLNWETVGSKITNYVTAFTGAFNGLVDGFNWESLGNTIGAGINTIVNTLSLLITGIDWVDLGNGLADSVNGLADEVDFTNVGNLIGQKFMILPRILLGFVSNLNWGEIGTQIGNALNGVVSSIDLSQIGEMLGKGLTGIFQTAIDFSATFDWKALGTNIYQGINSFFSNTDWAVVGQGISDFVMGILDAILTAIEGIDWMEVGRSIVDFILNIDWLGLVYKLVDIGAQIAWGLLQGIAGALLGIADWIKINVFDPIVNAIKELFGIHSPSTVMEEMGIFLMQGLLNGIQSLIDTVVESIREVWNGIKEVFEGFITFMTGVFTGNWEKAWGGIVKIFSGVGDTIKGIVNGILGVVESLANGVINGINFVIGALNNLSFDIPEWVPGLGGKTFGLNIPELSQVSIPRLATGAVIPANKEFMAVLGDQKHGNNLEAPEDLIRKIVREETAGLNSDGGDINLHLTVECEGYRLLQLIQKLDRERYARTKKPSFKM